MKKKNIEEKYVKLTDIQHCLQRPGRYIGSITPHTEKTHIVKDDKIVKQKLTWNQGLIKLFDEVISNSVDESKRKGSKLDTIKVKIDMKTSKLTVWDNGGIPVVIHKEHNVYVPEMIFSELKAGSNFDDTEEAFLTADTETGGYTTLTVNVQGLKYSLSVTADPCGSIGEGGIFWNDTSNYFCYCDGTNDLKMNDNSTACF